MKIEYLNEFIALAECGNYAKAAASSFISQSTLTRHIQAMEAELGCELFSRSRLGISSLTAMGSELLEGARGIVEIYDKTCERLADLREGFVGSLVIGMLYYATDTFMPPILAECKKSLPDVELKFSSGQPGDMLKGLLNGEFDAALVCYRYDQYDNIAYEEFARDTCIAMMDEGNPLAQRESCAVDDLPPESLVVYYLEDAAAVSCIHEQVLSEKGVVQRRVSNPGSVDLVPSLLRGTGDVIINPACMRGMNASGISMVPVEDDDMFFEMSFSYLKDNQNPALPLFFDVVKKAYGR